MTWQRRTIQLLGTERTQRLRDARVAIFGLGGVGSYAVESLARAGTGYLRLVDFDVVNATNINRQLYALHSTVECPKTALAAARVRDINPACAVDCRNEFVNAASVDGLLDPPVDIVVDAIDSLSSKVLLIAAAHERKFTVVSSMGAASKVDSSLIRTTDISESTICPLARMVRKKLHRRGIYRGIRCVYSLEPAGECEPAGEADREHDAKLGRPRTPLGSVSYLPGLFGLKVAEEVIRLLTKNE